MFNFLRSVANENDDSFNKLVDAVTVITLAPTQRLLLVFMVSGADASQIEYAQKILEDKLPKDVEFILMNTKNDSQTRAIAIITEKP